MINLQELFTKKEINCEKHGLRNVFTHRNTEPRCDECEKEKELEERKRSKEMEDQRVIERKKSQIEAIF